MRKLTALLTVAILLAPARALADEVPTTPPAETLPETPQILPSTHIKLSTGDGILSTPDNKLYVVPKNSHILIGSKWDELDREMFRLQEAETRLIAENQSLRKSQDGWKPGWVITTVVALGTVIATGWYIQSKI
jgi:hypothetical protein